MLLEEVSCDMLALVMACGGTLKVPERFLAELPRKSVVEERH